MRDYNGPSQPISSSNAELIIIHQPTGVALIHIGSLVGDEEGLSPLMSYGGEQTMLIEAGKRHVKEMKLGEYDVSMTTDPEYQLLLMLISKDVSRQDVEQLVMTIQDKFRAKYTPEDMMMFSGNTRVFSEIKEDLERMFTPKKGKKTKLPKLNLDELGIPQLEKAFLEELKKITKKSLTKLNIVIENDHLVELILPGLKLKVLPQTIGNLVELKSLNLLDNQLTELPQSMIHLDKLENVNLNNNQFRELPGALGLLKNLKHLGGVSNPWDSKSKEMINSRLSVLKEYCRKKASLFVFFSHAESDFHSKKINLKKLSEILQSKPEIYKCYYSEQDLQGNFDGFMKTYVPQSQVLVFFATHNSLKSKPCNLELQLAIDNDLHIIPVLDSDLKWSDLDEIPLTDQMGNLFHLSGEKGLRHQNKTSVFAEELYNYIYQLKRNIDLFDVDQRKLDKFHLDFMDDLISFLKSNDFKESLRKNGKKFLEIAQEYESGTMDQKEYYERVFKIIKTP